MNPRLFALIFWLAGLGLGFGQTDPARLVIGVIGDFGSGDTNEANVARLVKSWKPDFILTVGDNNYPSGAVATMDFNVGQYYSEFIGSYKGKYGPGAATNRFFPVLGNHDWYAPGAKPYLEYFTLPGNERYYTHRQGPVEVFALDSDSLEPHGNKADSMQALWLRRQLANSTATWKLVLCHEAPYSSGYWHGTWTGETAQMQWPFKAWGATAVLSGHDHIYERVHTNGLVYFVNGLGGDRIDPAARERVAGSRAAYNTTHGALRIDATATNLVFQFINWRGAVIDRYELPER